MKRQKRSGDRQENGKCTNATNRRSREACHPHFTHFNHRFNWPTVYSSGSLSNLEPGTSSSSVRTVKDGSEPLAIHTFPLQPLQNWRLFVWLMTGLKFRDVISALRYCTLNPMKDALLVLCGILTSKRQVIRISRLVNDNQQWNLFTWPILYLTLNNYAVSTICFVLLSLWTLKC